MNTSKPWYLSRTIWASIITIATASGSFFGLPFSGVDDAALTDAVLQVIAAVSGVVAILGRVSATTRIGG